MSDASQPVIHQDRHTAMTRHIYSNGSASIQELAAITGASEATIRRDLKRLEANGTITRTHGGAQIARRSDEKLAFEIREHENLAAKRAVADAAYRLIRPNSAILLDSGTTVLQLARRIRIDPLPITVVTDGLKVALELVNVPNVRVVLLGGDLRDENLSAVGPLTEAMLARLWFDQVFLGVGGIGEDATIYSLDSAGASANKHMLQRSGERHVLVDSSKFGRRGTYMVAPLADATSVIVDSGLSAHWRRKLGDAEINVVIVSAQQGPADVSHPSPMRRGG